MDYRDNRQRWAESHQVVHFYAGQWCTFTPALTVAYMAMLLRDELKRANHVTQLLKEERVRAGRNPITGERL